MARGKAQALPGMEDLAIVELQDAGIEYARIRDARIQLNREESTLKENIHSHAHAQAQEEEV